MGTSGSFGGSKNGLVPSWVDDPPAAPVASPENDEPSDGNGDSESGVGPAVYPPLQPKSDGVELSVARGSLTRGARTSDSRAIRRGAGRYVSASGGGKGASRRMSNSRVVAGGIAGLLRTFATEGPTEALASFNLEGLSGAPAVDVFVALTDALCPPGGTIDEAIARDAMLETIAALAAEGVGNFDEMTPTDLQEFFIGVVSRSIEGKILNEVGTNSIRLSPDLSSVERAQRMLHEFVEGCVRDRFSSSGSDLANLNSKQINDFVFDLYESAFSLMQALGDAS